MGVKGRGNGRSDPLVRIVLVGFAFGVGFLLVYYVTVRTIQGRLFGDASLRGALLTRSALADGSDTVLNVVSVASLLGAVALVATVALIRLERVRGLAAIGLLVGANVSTFVLKRYLLERPDLGIREVSPATLNSLPSGHATAVISASAALLFVVPTRWRYPTALAGLVVGTVTALATMSAGWHRAGDSMAAFLMVGVCGHRRRCRPDRRHRAPVIGRPLNGRGRRGGWRRRRAPAHPRPRVGHGPERRGTDPRATFGTCDRVRVGGLLITGTGITVLGGMLHVLELMDLVLGRQMADRLRHQWKTIAKVTASAPAICGCPTGHRWRRNRAEGNGTRSDYPSAEPNEEAMLGRQAGRRPRAQRPETGRTGGGDNNLAPDRRFGWLGQ